MAAHTLICGQSVSGKTYAARLLAAHQAKLGRKILVVNADGVINGWPHNSILFTTPKAVLDNVTASEENWGAAIYIDDAGDFTNYFTSEEGQRLATKSRHRGLTVTFIAQRANQLPPNIRGQCTSVYAFYTSKDDAKLLNAAYPSAADVMLAAAYLPKYSCVHWTDCGNVAEYIRFKAPK